MQPAPPPPPRRSLRPAKRAVIASVLGSTAASLAVFFTLVASDPAPRRDAKAAAAGGQTDDRAGTDPTASQVDMGGAPPTEAEAAGTARLSGVVTAGPESLPHEATLMVAGSSLSPSREVAVGPDGRFAVERLPEGVYELRARATGLAARPVVGIVLESDDAVEVPLRLEPAVSLEGRVVDFDTGRPVSGADVLATEDEASLTSTTTQTDARGHYRLADLRAVPHRLTVQAEGYISLATPPQVPEVAPAIHRLVAAATLVGRVVDTQGVPVSGIPLEIVGNSPAGTPLALTQGSLAFRSHFSGSARGPQGNLSRANTLGVTSGPIPPIPILPGAFGARPASVQTQLDGLVAESPEPVLFTTDTLGRFRVTGVPPGRLRVLASAPGWALTQSDALQVAAGALVEDIELVLRRGATLVGTAVDASGVAITRARITVECAGDPTPRATVTDAAGSFSVGGALGACQVTVTPELGLGATHTVTAIDGETHQLELLAPVSTESLECTIVDTSGSGVAGATVEVRLPSADRSLSIATRSDENGMALVAGLPPPPYLLDVTHQDYVPLSGVRVVAPSGARLVMQAGARVVGRLESDWDGMPLSGARVELRLPGGTAISSSRSGTEGRFEFQAVSSGIYTLYTSHSLVASQPYPVRIAAADVARGERDLGTIAMVQGGTVSGVVVDRLGVPTAGASVLGGDQVAATNSEGEFTLRGVPPGLLGVRATHPVAGQAAAVTVRVHPAQESPGIRLALDGRDSSSHMPQTSPAPEAPVGASGSGGVGVAIDVATGPEGVSVTTVVEGSRAERAGLRVGDVIRSIDGEEVAIAAQARSLLRGTEGSQCVFRLIRNGRQARVVVQRERLGLP